MLVRGSLVVAQVGRNDGRICELFRKQTWGWLQGDVLRIWTLGQSLRGKWVTHSNGVFFNGDFKKIV